MNYQEWRKQKIQSRLLATGETDTSDLTEKHYIKYLEEELKSLLIKATTLTPPQSIIKIVDVQRTPKRKTIKSIVIETENFYNRIEKDSDFTKMNFNWEELKELVNNLNL